MTIPKGLIIYRGKTLTLENARMALKYGYELNYIGNPDCMWKDIPIVERILRKKSNKRQIAGKISYDYQSSQKPLMNDLKKKVSSLRKLEFHTYRPFDFDFYHSQHTTDSQFTIESDRGGEDDDIHFVTRPFEEINQVVAKRIFKKAKRLEDLFIYIGKINPHYELILSHPLLLSNLKSLSIKIDIFGPDDLLPLRDLLKIVKRRQCWPHLKTMVIRLRHSYNKQNCAPRFIEFCQNLQDIAHTIKDSPWIKLKLKVKYMNRHDEASILKLQETLDNLPQLVSLSLSLDTSKDLTPLVKTIEGMENLRKFSMRLYQPGKVLTDVVQALIKVKSLKRVKINGKSMLSSENHSVDHQAFLQSLGGLSQITSFHFQGNGDNLDPTSWASFSQAVSKLTQLEALTIKTYVYRGEDAQNDYNFEGFFEELKKFEKLRTLCFEMDNGSGTFKHIGTEAFAAFCQALQNLKKLEKANLSFPWKYYMNSDIHHLANALPYLQQLEDFTLHFYNVETSQPVENSTVIRFSNALQGLNAIKSLKMSMEIVGVSESTYESLLALSNHLKQRKAKSDLMIGSTDRIDQQLDQNLLKLMAQIRYWTIDR